MTIESMNNQYIKQLKQKRNNHEAERLVNVKNRDRINMTIADLQEKIDDLNKYIEHLEASAPRDPDWQAGDRFEWKDESRYNQGTVLDVYRGDSYAQYHIRTDAGGELTMGSEFEQAARKVQS